MEQAGHTGTGAMGRDTLRQVLIDLSIMTVVGVLLAFVGPFGSFDLPLEWRFVYWLGYAYIGYACYRPVTVLAARMATRLDLPEWTMVLTGVFVGTVPMSAAVWVLGRMPGNLRWPTLSEALLNYFYVFVIGAGVTLLFMAMNRGPGDDARAASASGTARPDTRAPETQPAPATKANQPAFFDRLPAHLGSDLLALEMEDHYVRAHTALGSELILMRLRDAVAELEGIDGMQVHRSWWVARHAVEDVTRDGRNVRLVLPGGLEAPVSRAKVAELRQVGWF